MDNEGEYVIIKLVNGDQLMAILINEDDESIEVAYPILFESVIVDSENPLKTDIKSFPFCLYSEDNFYEFNKYNVLFVSPLRKIIIPHYEKLIDAFGMNRELNVSVHERNSEDDVTISSTSFYIEGTDTIN